LGDVRTKVANVEGTNSSDWVPAWGSEETSAGGSATGFSALVVSNGDVIEVEWVGCECLVDEGIQETEWLSE